MPVTRVQTDEREVIQVSEPLTNRVNHRVAEMLVDGRLILEEGVRRLVYQVQCFTPFILKASNHCQTR